MSKCPICFKKANYTTSCNHTFCKKCLSLWKDTCPLCRSHVELDWPKTRAMSRSVYVVQTIRIMANNIAITRTTTDKLKFADILLNFVWDNRIIIRKNNRACKLIHTKSLLLERQCKERGLSPPKILKKTLII